MTAGELRWIKPGKVLAGWRSLDDYMGQDRTYVWISASGPFLILPQEEMALGFRFLAVLTSHGVLWIHSSAVETCSDPKGDHLCAPET